MIKIFTKTLLLSSLLLGLNAAHADVNQASDSNVSTIDAFSMMPVIRSVAVSDDGKKLAILRATSKHGDYVVEIRDPMNLTSKPIILGADKMQVSSVTWLSNKKLGVMFRQILKDGASKRWVNKFAIINSDGKGKWLIPLDRNSTGFSLMDVLPDNPDEILVEADINNNYIPDVIKVNLDTGRTKTVFRGNTKINNGFLVDHDGDVRIGNGWNSIEGAIEIFAREKGEDDWKSIYLNSPENRESYDVLGFSKENPNQLYVRATLGEDKAGIYLYDIKTKQYSERQFGLKSVDVDGVQLDDEGNLVSFSYTTSKPKRYFLDPNEEALFNGVKGLFDKDKYVSIISRSKDDNVIVVRTESGKDTGSYYMITNKKNIDKLGEKLPLIDKAKLADVKYIKYKARDGRDIRAYVTKPQGEGPFPAVVLPHGGPWVRDTVIFDEWAQLLAYHGYVVIQPNYRGSLGYGLEHWIAGDNNWGLKMQDDLDDAALYLVEKGYTTKDKLAMFGWSYGGYAAFASSMRSDNLYQCSIAGAGVSDLSRINAELSTSRYLNILQKPTISGVSPLSQVDKVNIPILVVHGDIDSVVPVEHSREFVDKLKSLKKDYAYFELEDAEHYLDTLSYDHKKKFYSELVNWLDNKCGLK